MEDAELKVVVWNNFSDTDDGTTYVADFDNIRVAQDAMVFSIAFVPPDTDVGMPPWAQNLPELARADSGQVIPTARRSPERPPSPVRRPSRRHGRTGRQHRRPRHPAATTAGDH